MPVSKASRNAIKWDLLGLYLSDHVAGATAGIGRMKRMRDAFANTAHQHALDRILTQLCQERQFYYHLLERHGLPRRRYRQIISAIAEKVGRLKLNGALVGASPMTPVLETELMCAAVVAKIGGWRALLVYREELGIPLERVNELIADGQNQLETLERIHDEASAKAFRRQSAIKRPHSTTGYLRRNHRG